MKKKKMTKNEELKLPKAILVLFNQETGEIIAENGRWNRIPSDGEKLVAEYKNKHQTKYGNNNTGD